MIRDDGVQARIARDESPHFIFSSIGKSTVTIRIVYADDDEPYRRLLRAAFGMLPVAS